MSESIRQNLPDLPQHDEIGSWVRRFEWACLLTCIGLLLAQCIRLGLHPELWQWWMIPVALLGMLTADFITGMVHWFADTWFNENMPILGRRFLRPFRVHHVNPRDFVRRDFVDINGDTAMLVIPILILMTWIPLNVFVGQIANVFLMALCAISLLANQFHKWAHMSNPPRIVRWLQRRRLILSKRDHARHHAPPHTTNYCIALGWCNPILARIGFFPKLERLVARLTGLQPRSDDESFQAQLRKVSAK